MKEFIWSTCLNEEEGPLLVLKQNEEDFIVREGFNGHLTNIKSISLDDLTILDDLPLITEKLLSSIDRIEERRTAILGRITEIEDKEERTMVHKLYSMHPFIHTKSVRNPEGKNDILIVFDTHHTMHTFSVEVTKKGKTTHDATEILARYLKIPGYSIKYAGNKDKKAITTQRMSVEGVSYLGIHKLSKFLQSIQKDRTQPVHYTEETKDSSIKHSVFTSRSREAKDEELDSENIITVRGSQIINELSTINKRLQEARIATPEQTDEEYLADARNMEEGILIGPITRIESGLKLGDLERNRFYLKLEITDRKDLISRKIDQIKENGFANYYGNQRFGHGMTNHIIGEAIINRNYQSAVDLIIKSLGTLDNSPKAKQALDLAEQKEYKQAADILPGKFQTEKILLISLSKKIPPKIILNRIRRENRTMYMHSYQSKLFNDSLEKRLTDGLKNEEFTIYENISSVTSKEDINNKLSKEHSPSIRNVAIPLYPTLEIDSEEQQTKSEVKGGFRKAVVIPQYMNYKIDGNILDITFDLPPGTYATMLVKEIAHNRVKEITN